MKTRISGKINKISAKIKRNCSNIESIKKLNEISGTNGIIVGYINKCNEEGVDVFQKNIEANFGITRSTASKVITLMEKKGLIVRESSSTDARLKKLVLTEKARILNENCKEDLAKFDNSLLMGFTLEEIDLFISFLERIENNIDRKGE